MSTEHNLPNVWKALTDAWPQTPASLCMCLPTGNKDEVYIELVVGLGEALVGNFPGSALRAVVSKPALQQLLQQATSAGSPADAGARHSFVGRSGRCGWRSALSPPAKLVLRLYVPWLWQSQ